MIIHCGKRITRTHVQHCIVNMTITHTHIQSKLAAILTSPMLNTCTVPLSLEQATYCDDALKQRL